ncbi:hypothetical protein [Ochrobactrum sp. BTU1]|uniref:hypothetical protein n=1 Tax=Ochrobactrum sp. BTU1 TaxID=2840456 RepID=UPI001C05760A|nr:hypothetical protein KMS41_16390 [Ochrobactrum sp. BTU1]
MAVLPDYVSGTITLANGSTTVTGTGTMFQAAAFKAGDTLQIQNLTAVIASVNSNTSLTLTAPWTGTSLTNAPYRARYLPDGARVTAQTTTLIELLGNGVLSSLAEIGVEEGKVPVGNSTGGYVLEPTSSFGVKDPKGSLGKLAAIDLGNRQILQTDGAGNLTTLALAARQILQTDANGALKTLALVANKFLRTDANGDLALSDLGAAAIALLNLSGTPSANQLPYLTGAAAAGLTPFTALARSMLAGSTGAAMFATMGAASGFANGGSWLRLPNNWILQMGTIAGTTDSAGVLSISLPTSYTDLNNFKVVAWNGDYNITTILSYVRSAVWPATGGFAVRFRNPTTGALDASQARRLDWLAIGY